MDTWSIIVGSFVVLTLAVFTMLFFIVFLNKKRKLLIEKEQLKADYEKTILQTQVEIQEQTFSSISQEIHDNVGQILSLVKVQLNIMDEREEKDRGMLADAKENISKAMTDLRDIAKGLSSDRIRIVGLAAAVQQELQRINRLGGVYITLQEQGQEKQLEPQKQLILFRVIQECLQNIMKHAAADTVTIRFDHSQDFFKISISDNGKGFNFKKERLQHGGLGLQNIFKRLELIGGAADIQSVLKKGTTIKLTIPYV